MTMSDTTTVVHMHRAEWDVKITRNYRGLVPDPPAFGCFGNPFKLGDYSRDECIGLFRDYFLERVDRDPIFRAAVLALRGKRLACFCHPLPCHGDVIKEWLDHPLREKDSEGNP